EAYPNSNVPITLALGRPVGGNFAQRAPLKVREFEVLEHDVDQLFERDVSFVVVDAGAVASPAVALALALPTDFADDLPGPRLTIALSHPRAILAIDEAVFLDAAERNLDDLIPVFADNGLFGDDVGDIFTNRLTHFFTMAQTVAGGTVGTFGIGG